MKNGPYILIIPPKDYPGKKYRGRYAYEHHVNYWLTNDIILKKGQNIHHKNGIKTDNRIQNLELLDDLEHKKEHGKQVSDFSKIELVCSGCGNTFKASGNDYRAKIKKGKNKNFYCNRNCYKVNANKHLHNSTGVA